MGGLLRRHVKYNQNTIGYDTKQLSIILKSLFECLLPYFNIFIGGCDNYQ